MTEIIFNMIGSEIHDTDRWSLYVGDNDKEKNPNGYFKYFDYELFCVQPVIEWCDQQNLDFQIEDAHYAMQLAFIFKDETDAMAFKLRWL